MSLNYDFATMGLGVLEDTKLEHVPGMYRWLGSDMVRKGRREGMLTIMGNADVSNAQVRLLLSMMRRAGRRRI